MLPQLVASTFSTEEFNAAWIVPLPGAEFPLSDVYFRATVRAPENFDDIVVDFSSGADTGAQIIASDEDAEAESVTLAFVAPWPSFNGRAGDYVTEVMMERDGAPTAIAILKITCQRGSTLPRRA